MKPGIGALAAATLAIALTGCSANHECVATTIENAPTAVAPGEDVTLELAGVWGACNDTGGNWPWSGGDSGPPDSVGVVVRDATGDVWVGTTVEVADDATATATVTLPDELPSTLTVTIDGEEVGTLMVAN